ncbi:IS701 family transposase [Streptomyces bottropensis]
MTPCGRSWCQFLARPDGVLVLDETAFLKKGRMSAGVAPQYAGITGQIENCQVAVFCAYATDTGRALIDRELYLPAAWCADAGRCRTQHIPRARAKAVVTKPELGRRMVERCRRAKVPFGGVAADSAYGQDRKLRAALERRRIPYVMAVPVDETVSTHGTGPLRVDKTGHRYPAGLRTPLLRRGSQGPALLRLGTGRRHLARRRRRRPPARPCPPAAGQALDLRPRPGRLLRRARQSRHPDRRDRPRDGAALVHRRLF